MEDFCDHDSNGAVQILPAQIGTFSCIVKLANAES